MLSSQSDVFTLSDEELGETEFVTHYIDTGDVRPVRAALQRPQYKGITVGATSEARAPPLFSWK